MPNFSCEYLPIKRPKKVKDAAQRLKITPDKMTSLVMALNPRPVEKLSKLTETDTKNILNKFNSKNLSSCLINSIIISIPINKRIIPKRKLTLIFKKVIILLPKSEPKRGIKKCIMPTRVQRNTIFLLLILNVPILRHTENVSIDKDIPIRNKDRIIDTLSPN